jgi:membrane protein implicated in regulation of membrane protease activity
MFTDFPGWWDSLTLMQQIYWCLAVPASLFFAFQLVLTFVGGDVDLEGGHDFEYDHDTGIGVQFFTLKNMVGFFTIFSWTGIAALDAGASEQKSLLVATLAGLAMMALMTTLFYFMSRMSASGTMRIENALGKTGEVYLPVKANRGGIGKIMLKVQGSLREMEAITDDQEDLATGTVVKVKEIIDQNILNVSKY